MNNMGFENNNPENKNFPPYSTPNNDVEIDFSEIEMLDEGSNENNVNNYNNSFNNQNPYNNGINSNNQPVFQPNYYSYQHGYQQNYPPNGNFGYSQSKSSKEFFQRYFEKKAVKKTSNHIGIGMLLFYAVQIVFTIALGFFINNKEFYDFINDPAVSLELNIILTLFGFGIAAIFIFKTEGEKADRLISYGPPEKGKLLASLLTGIGFCYVANISVSLLQTKFEGILPFVQNDIELPNGILGFILSVLSVAVAPALIEELLFRGAIMGTLLKFGKGFAVFTSAFLFALVHGNLVQIPFAFLVGLVIGALVIETNSIWTGVIIHFANNFVSVCLDYAGKYVDKDILNVMYLVLLSLFIVIGILSVYVLSIKNKKLFSYEKTPHISTSVQRFGWFSSSVCMIIYFVIIALEILAMQTSVN